MKVNAIPTPEGMIRLDIPGWSAEEHVDAWIDWQAKDETALEYEHSGRGHTEDGEFARNLATVAHDVLMESIFPAMTVDEAEALASGLCALVEQMKKPKSNVRHIRSAS
jgi:hypothetical protein